MSEGIFSRNGKVVDEPYARRSSDPQVAPNAVSDRPSPVDTMRARQGGPETWGPLVVPDDSLFLLGDNRARSADSRYRGFFPMTSILGRLRMIYYSWNSETGKVRWERIGEPTR
jgi:signal peptidase I